jgi:mannose/fructose/N-acetylgalactosamine-specific phosphotransferase system component IIC
MTTRRSNTGLVVAGAIIILVGFGVALVKTLELPNYWLWVLVGAGLGGVGLVRRVTRPRPPSDR